MSLFRFFGLALMLLGIIAGGLIVLLPFTALAEAGLRLHGSLLTLWLLFVASVLVGFSIFSAASGKPRTDRAFTLLGGALLALGGASGIALLLNKVGLAASTDTVSWWMMFVGSSIAGALAALMGSANPASDAAS